MIVGRGSNLLVADAGFAGLAVVLDPTGFGSVEIEGTGVRAGASVPMPALARQTVEAGLTGFEWAVGVPGSVGGGARMNAGGHGSDMAASVIACSVVELARVPVSVQRWPAERLDFGYRRSAIADSDVVVEVELGLRPGDVEDGRRQIREIVKWRREHQPGGQNAGSVFANPPGDSAGRLIDAAGLRGLRVGGAEVSPKHANFIQADPGGSADDVLRLLRLVQYRVEQAQGVKLNTEVRLVGFDETQPRVEVESRGRS